LYTPDSGARTRIVRVNGLDTGWGAADMAAFAGHAGADALLLPKVNAPADLDAAHALAPAKPLWAMMETALGMLNAAHIAAHPALAGMVMGTNDLAKEMRARQTPDRAPFHAALSLSVAAARLYGLTILDGVYNDIDNEEGLIAICEQGVDFGFDGKTLIHPKQVEICNRVFSPSEAEVAWAKAVIAAFALPENQGKGAIRVEGRMAELLHLVQAESLVAVAAAIAEAAAA
jgi:citrate lyase subunit beta/citryl-CoA lyase